MKVVITSATRFEAEKIINKIEGMNFKNLEISFSTNGVGMLASCYAITKLLYEQKPNLLIQAGIAGCFDVNIPLAKVVVIKEEVVGDMGVEENGKFVDLCDMKFQREDDPPYITKKLVNPFLQAYNILQLDEVSGLTVNEISSRQQRIKQLRNKYNPVVESMEGAALHYACLQQQVPFIQLRATSNYVGERDKSKWKINEALNNLCDVTIEYLLLLDKNEQRILNNKQ